MKGNQRFYLRVGKKKFDLVLERNITVIKDKSATGKSTFIRYLRNHIVALKNTGHSDINVECNKKFYVLDALNWDDAYSNINKYKDSIIFIDEGNKFVTTVEFARFVKLTGSFFVLITRVACDNLAYSVTSICRLDYDSNDYTYTLKSLYQINSPGDFDLVVLPDVIITEDTGSGEEFYNQLNPNIQCIGAGANSNVLKEIRKIDNFKRVLVICDNAAFGAHYDCVNEEIKDKNFSYLFLPESFEYLILQSGLFEDEETVKLLKNPSSEIDSDEYLTWERYFTYYLCKISKGTDYEYSKSELMDIYKKEDTVKTILDSAGLGRLLAKGTLNKTVNKMSLV